jgi:hypothetical protein
MRTFQSVLDHIEKHTQLADWTTDTGHILPGVLVRRDNRVILNVNSKGLTDTINFEYIYSNGPMGNKRIIHPFDTPSCKYIPNAESGWSIEAFMIIDEQARQIPEIANHITFIYDSFIWDKVPEKNAEERRFRKLLSQMQDMNTDLGKVTVSLQILEGYSMHPSSYEKRMDEIVITVEPSNPLSTQDILMWNARFGQLLAIVHKERVITQSIQRGLDTITMPGFVENYQEASYAYRQPIDTSSFVVLMKSALPTFVNNYSKIATFVEDLVQYYFDYPLNPPDSIQLLRLFTSLEQCANFAQKSEKILKRGLTAEQSKRQKEFDKLLNKAEDDKQIPEPVRTYLRDMAQKFYVSSGSLSAPKHKISALAQFLNKKYGTHNQLSNLSNVEIILKMRHIVAHGFYDPKSSDKFYANRNQ